MRWSAVGAIVPLTLSLLVAPLAAEAQPAHVRRIGVLAVEGGICARPERSLAEFGEALRERGYVEGQNILVDSRSVAAGQTDRLNDLAVELVRLPVGLIVALATPAAQAAKRTTTAIPIVFHAGDPAGTGLVASLARPGGNVTGVGGSGAEIGGKCLDLLRELLPTVTHVAALVHATDPFARPFLEHIESAARSLGVRIHPVVVRGAEEFDGAFAMMVEERVGAVIVQPILATPRAAVLAVQHHLPAISQPLTFVEAGGLMTYASNRADAWRRIATYVDKILLACRRPPIASAPASLRLSATPEAWCYRPSQGDDMPHARSLRAIAHEMKTAQDEVRQIEPFTSHLSTFDVTSAYAVAQLIHEARLDEGAVPVGRKIAFTNPDMWSLYGVREPLWAYLYDTTVVRLPARNARCNIERFAEPKIEPEIVFHFHSVPPVGGALSAMLACVDWVAHAFEIVQSHFPGWKFQAADTVADWALHGTLLVGEPQAVDRLGKDVIEALERFAVTLSCDGKVREVGRGSNVLGSPLAAIAHLIGVLAKQPQSVSLQASEMVTTGTITTAQAVHAGETWQTALAGIALPGLSVEFVA